MPVNVPNSDISKNETAWNGLERKYSILAEVGARGIAKLTANQIREFREPRLLTKIGERTSLPPFLADNGLSILPLSRNEFAIGAFETFHDLPDFDHVSIKTVPEPEQITFNSRVNSEASSLLLALETGMISDFLGENPVKLTIMGRMGSGDFDFHVGGYSHSLSVSGSQIEIDGGFEGPNSIALVEAKATEVKSFLVRQIYYPYRTWSARVAGRKPIRNVFLTISNDKFQFVEYGFGDDLNYSSIIELRKAAYQLSNSILTSVVVRSFLSLPEIPINNVVPFPQADSVNRIVSLLTSVVENGGAISKEDVATIQVFHERQSDYYLNAGVYLGFLYQPVHNSAFFSITPAGEKLVSAGPAERTKLLMIRLLADPIIRNIFANGNQRISEVANVGLKQIAFQAVAHCVETGEIQPRLSESTIERRAQTMLAWHNWVLEHISD